MQQILSLVKSFLAEMNGQLAPEAVIEEEKYHLVPADPRGATDGFFEINPLPSRPSAFQLFQSGRSQTYLIGQIVVGDDVRPVHYASVASAILRRDNGHLSPYTRPLTADLLLIDTKGLDNLEVIERYREGIEIIETKPEGQSFKDRRLAAMKEVARVLREMQEEGLLACNENREPGILVAVDGSLSHIEGAVNMPGVVGIVPANPEVLGEDNLVLSCPYGARTKLDSSSSPAVFYMRLRDHFGKNADFGLLRAEIGLNPDGSKPDEDWASDVASLLLKERLPVKPDSSGWDKRIFALQDTSKYISTLIPTPRIVITYFGRSIS